MGTSGVVSEMGSPVDYFHIDEDSGGIAVPNCELQNNDEFIYDSRKLKRECKASVYEKELLRIVEIMYRVYIFYRPTKWKNMERFA